MVRTYPHYNPFSVRDPEKLDWQRLFSKKRGQSLSRQSPLYLEIGCSNGRWLFDFARRYPERNIIGVETRGKYVHMDEERIVKYGFKNVHVVRANINTAINTLFDDESLQDVFILFPDPWYKEKHLKRRVVKSEFLIDLYKKMVTGGRLYIATDKQSFALEMLEVLKNGPFKNCEQNFADSTEPGIVTEIEEFNLNLGKQIYRMNFQKN